MRDASLVDSLAPRLVIALVRVQTAGVASSGVGDRDPLIAEVLPRQPLRVVIDWEAAMQSMRLPFADLLLGLFIPSFASAQTIISGNVFAGGSGAVAPSLRSLRRPGLHRTSLKSCILAGRSRFKTALL
jgi:hypothetical protein